MSITTRFKLSLMMFLEFFIWGAWFVTFGTFLAANLSADPVQSGYAYSTQSYGAIIAPFIIGLIADRYFNAEKILAILHLVGAVLMFQMYRTGNFGAFFPLIFVYMVLFMPTLALVNSVAFNQVRNAEKEFGAIRVWGTIGWIVAGLLISYAFHWDSKQHIATGMLKYTFLMTAVASLVMGIFSFSLPKTPPRVQKEEKFRLGAVLGLDALKLLKRRNYLIFFIASVLICIPLAFYYQNTNLFLANINLPNPTGKQTIGQMSEVFFMLMLPVFFSKFGLKKTLALAMAAWGLRYVLFAYGDAGAGTWMLLTGLALHGICYDFFFVSGQIYTDAEAGEKYKSAAQGLITLATYGLGMWVGFYIAGIITKADKVAGITDWRHVWLFPAAFAGVVLVLFLLLFREKKAARSAMAVAA